MSEKHEIKVGDTAVLKVGRNEVPVKVDGWGTRLHGEERLQWQGVHRIWQSPQRADRQQRTGRSGSGGHTDISATPKWRDSTIRSDG